MGPTFRYVAHFIERSAENWKSVAFQTYFIQSESQQWTSNWNRISYFLFHFVEPKMSQNGQYYLKKTFKKATSRVH